MGKKTKWKKKIKWPVEPSVQGKKQIELIRGSVGTAKHSTGRRLLLRYLSMSKDSKLTRGEALLAKCCDCMAYYEDGRVDCQNIACPLYPYMPYRQDKYEPI